MVIAAVNKKLFTFEKLPEKKFASDTTIARPTAGKKTNQAIQKSVAYFDEILPLKKQRSQRLQFGHISQHLWVSFGQLNLQNKIGIQRPVRNLADLLNPRWVTLYFKN